MTNSFNLIDSVQYDFKGITPESFSGGVLELSLPNNFIPTSAVLVVTTAFNGTTPKIAVRSVADTNIKFLPAKALGSTGAFYNTMQDTDADSSVDVNGALEAVLTGSNVTTGVCDIHIIGFIANVSEFTA